MQIVNAGCTRVLSAFCGAMKPLAGLERRHWIGFRCIGRKWSIFCHLFICVDCFLILTRLFACMFLKYEYSVFPFISHQAYSNSFFTILPTFCNSFSSSYPPLFFTWILGCCHSLPALVLVPLSVQPAPRSQSDHPKIEIRCICLFKIIQ